MKELHSNRQEKRTSKIKKWIGKLHLWFGLGIGLIVFLVSITGALHVFKEDIQYALRKDFIYHNEPNIQNKKVLPLKELEEKVEAQTSEKYPIHWVEIPLDKSKSYKFYYYEHDPKAWNFFDEYPVYKSVYTNPFTGKVLKIQDEKIEFFTIVKSIHWSFLLKSEWGTYVVGIPVLIFLFMLVSGIILWWPKNKSAKKQRIWFRWKNIKNWKRKNYDLHSILGFYSSFVALIVAITGLFYSFLCIQSFMYFVFSGGETTLPDLSKYTTTAPASMRNESTLDDMSIQVEQHYPHASAYSIDVGHPHIDDHEHENFTIYIRHLEDRYWKYSEMIFDENSGKLLLNRPYEKRNLGEKYLAANYDIHVGAILGLPGKLLAFIVSLICASFPVTGFLVWWGRRNKKIKSFKTL